MGDFSGRRSKGPRKHKGAEVAKGLVRETTPRRGAGMSAGLLVARKSVPRSGMHIASGQAGPSSGPGPRPSPVTPAPSSFLFKKHTAGCVTFALRAEWTCSPREREVVWAPHNQPCQLPLGVELRPLSGSPGSERAGAWRSCPLPHRFFHVTRTLGASLGQGELHGDSLRRLPGAGCVCSHKVCTLSNSLVTPAPGAGNVASPTALALVEDPRHGKP